MMVNSLEIFDLRDDCSSRDVQKPPLLSANNLEESAIQNYGLEKCFPTLPGPDTWQLVQIRSFRESEALNSRKADIRARTDES